MTILNKFSYLGSEFSLTFPSIDIITDVIRHIAKGMHLYKTNFSSPHTAGPQRLPLAWFTLAKNTD